MACLRPRRRDRRRGKRRGRGQVAVATGCSKECGGRGGGGVVAPGRPHGDSGPLGASGAGRSRRPRGGNHRDAECRRRDAKSGCWLPPLDAPWILNDVIKSENVGEDGVGEETAAGDRGMAATTTRNAVARPARPPPFGMKEEERAPPVLSDAFCAESGIAATRCQKSSMVSRAAEAARVTALSKAHPVPIPPHCPAVRRPPLQL